MPPFRKISETGVFNYRHWTIYWKVLTESGKEKFKRVKNWKSELKTNLSNLARL